jgi:hypothetical protein
MQAKKILGKRSMWVLIQMKEKDCDLRRDAGIQESKLKHSKRPYTGLCRLLGNGLKEIVEESIKLCFVKYEFDPDVYCKQEGMNILNCAFIWMQGSWHDMTS